MLSADNAEGEAGTGAWTRWRARLYVELEMVSPGRPLGRVQKIVSVIILLAVIHAVLVTEDAFVALAPAAWLAADVAFTLAFSVEYLARIFAAGEDPRFAGLRGRLKWAVRPSSLIDLVAIAPSLLLAGWTPAWVLRLLRVLRIMRISRVGPLARGYAILMDAVAERKADLLAAASVSALLMLFAATGLHMIEAAAQPEAFGSIPRAAWWAIATLTTVGYGDVFPVTVAGKMFAGAAAVSGIGVIAMPTGILSAALSDAMTRARKEDDQ